MKRQYTFLLFILFSFLPLPFLIGIFKNSPGGFSAIWDAISLIIVYVGAILIFLMTFNNTNKCSKPFFIYKLIWLQEMFILSGIMGVLIGFVFTMNSMSIPPPPGMDPTNIVISNMAISLITLVYGFVGALTIYLIQKFYELKSDDLDDIEVKKPKEGFLLSSFIYSILFIVFECSAIYVGSANAGGYSVLVSIESLICIVTLLVIFVLFYNGNSFIDLLKNLFWYVPDTGKNILYNLKYIHNMKKISAMFICVSLLCVPIVMLVSLFLSGDNNEWDNPTIGLENGGLLFFWILDFIILLTIMEGREVTKLYFETGKISAGDRFYSIKYILAPAFLLFFTFSLGIMISFIL